MTSRSRFVGTTSPLARVPRVNGILTVATVPSGDRMIEIDPPRAMTTTQRFARGICTHRQHTGYPVDLLAPALQLFDVSSDVSRWAEACAQQWPGFVLLIGPEREVRDPGHDSSPRGIVNGTPVAALYEELHRALPGSTVVSAAEHLHYNLSDSRAKLFPGRGTAYRFDNAHYAVHVFGGTDDAMIRITETDPRTGRYRRVEWPLLDKAYHATSGLERCLAGIRQATAWIAVEQKIEEREVLAAIDDSAATEIAYGRDADGRAMAFFEFENGQLYCTNGTIVHDTHPDGRIPLSSWDAAITWIEQHILSGRIAVRRDTNITALSVPTDVGPVLFEFGFDNYGVAELVPPLPIALSQWAALTSTMVALEATGARGGTKEIPTALQAHVALPFQNGDGTFTAAPLVSVLRQWRHDLPLLKQLIPAEPGRYVFIQDLNDAVFAALDASDLEDRSALGVAKVYGAVLAEFLRYHGAKYAALNMSPLCCHALQAIAAADPAAREWISAQAFAPQLDTLKNQPTVEIRLSDTLMTETGLFSAWLNEAMLQFFFGWTLRAIASAR